MSTAILIPPITAATFTVHQSRKFHKPTKICAKRLKFVGEFSYTVTQSRKFQKPGKICANRLHFWGQFDCRKSVCSVIRRRNQNSMKGFDGVRASTSDDGVEDFEQEALMEGSLSFGAGGLEATLNTLSKWLISALFAAIILWRHDAEALWAAMGAVLNSVLSVVLKKTLNQERPIPTLRSDPGMPSSHAQSIFYTITFVTLSVVEWYGFNGISTTLCGLFFILGSYLSWLRVSQQLHTTNQVIVGALLGSIFSIFWYWSWNSFILNSFASFLWVRIVVVVGAIGFCLGFLYHVYQSWIVEDR